MVTVSTPIRVGWKVSSLSSTLASVRYRALMPLLALGGSSVESSLMYSAEDPVLEKLDVLVLVKSFKPEDVALVQRASARGVRVVFDLCDNVFIDAYQADTGEPRPRQLLQVMAPFLDAMVVTTEPLAEAVRHVLPNTPVYVIADGIETHETLRDGEQLIQKALREQRRFRPRFLRFMQRTVDQFSVVSLRVRSEGLKILPSLLLRYARRLADRTVGQLRKPSSPVPTRETATCLSNSVGSSGRNSLRIVWFGNHGAPHARFGMLDLLEFKEALEVIAKEFDVELVVISNNARKYEQHIRPFAIPSHYVEWSPGAIDRWLKGATVAVIPNTLDAFSLCKSANRTVLATSLGVPVVATATPALEPLADHIHLGHPLEGLRRYLGDPAAGQMDAAAAFQLASQIFGPEVIGESWRSLLNALMEAPPRQRMVDAQCVMVMNLVQDLDLALPVMAAARAEGLTTMAWCSAGLIAKSPRVLTQLRSANVALRIFADDPQLEASDWPPSLRVLMTVAETNLGPHRFSRRLSELAARRGVHVVTMQHGFENVGLTYDDTVHPIANITIAASRIYIWGPPSTLNPGIQETVRSRCVSMGCPKAAVVPTADLKDQFQGKQVVGIFENLHWQRYDDAYRHAFLENVDALAAAFPDVLFLVKPHHAGLWLTRRYEGEHPVADNLLIADPQQTLWENHTAPALFGWMKAIITTPSTVALDAARQALPVAVVAGSLALDNYSPLTLLRTAHDWKAFVRDALGEQAVGDLRSRSTAFVDRVLVPGDAAQCIAMDLASLSRN